MLGHNSSRRRNEGIRCQHLHAESVTVTNADRERYVLLNQLLKYHWYHKLEG